MFEKCKTCEYVKLIPGFRVKEYKTKLNKIFIDKIEEEAICTFFNKSVNIISNGRNYNSDNESFIIFPNR